MIRGIYPEKILLRLPYSQTIRYVDIETSNPSNPYVFSGNSLDEPEFAQDGGLIAAHQPLGVDQYLDADIYRRYRVASSTMEIWASNEKSDPDFSPWIVIYAGHTNNDRDLTAGPVALAQMRERQQYYKFRLAPAFKGPVMQKMKVTLSTAKIFGINKEKAREDRYSSIAGASPLSNWFWNIAYLMPNSGYIADPGTGLGFRGSITVKLTYNCVLFDRKPLETSL